MAWRRGGQRGGRASARVEDDEVAAAGLMRLYSLFQSGERAEPRGGGLWKSACMVCSARRAAEAVGQGEMHTCSYYEYSIGLVRT